MPDDLKHRCHQCRKPNPRKGKEAVERLREWVDKGKAWAQVLMGEWYRHGVNDLKQSNVMAAMLFEKAVAHGDPGAMNGLACLYQNGQGVAQSDEKAVGLFTVAAEQGHVGAMFNLGNMYGDGQGVVQSFKKRVEHFAMAVEQGHVSAMYNLGILYEDGQELHNRSKKLLNIIPWLQNRDMSKRRSI